MQKNTCRLHPLCRNEEVLTAVIAHDELFHYGVRVQKGKRGSLAVTKYKPLNV
jgi:hypothetical protein